MESHYQLSDREFARRFEHCELPPHWFTHEAHLRLAWIYIDRYGIELACDRLCAEITKFDQTFGDGSKFNKTVTIAAARAVHHFMQKARASDFRSFIMEFPQLKTRFKDLLGQHYSFDIFKSEKARLGYLEPDLVGF